MFQRHSFSVTFQSLTSSWLKVTSEAVSMKLMDLWHSCHWVPRLSIPKYSLWCVCPCPNMFHMPEDVEMMSCWHRLCLPHCLDFMSWGTFYLGCASQGHHCIKQEPTNCCFLGDLIVSVHSKGWVRVTLGLFGTWQSQLTQSSLVESRKKSQLLRWVTTEQKPCLQLSLEVMCSSKITYLGWYINVLYCGCLETTWKPLS